MDAKNNVIAWIDVETTGLNVDRDCLLEVACLVTDTDLNLLDEAGFTAVVYYPDAYVDTLKQCADEYVLNMHEKTGLWAKLPAGKMLPGVDAELTEYIQRFSPMPKQARLGGSSVSFDRKFIEQYLPKVEAHINHRNIDVSSIAELAKWWVGPEMVYEKQYLHEALADIKESIAELKFHREQWLGRGVELAQLALV